MTIGPEPMMRIFEMSLRLGIEFSVPVEQFPVRGSQFSVEGAAQVLLRPLESYCVPFSFHSSIIFVKSPKR